MPASRIARRESPGRSAAPLALLAVLVLFVGACLEQDTVPPVAPPYPPTPATPPPGTPGGTPIFTWLRENAVGVASLEPDSTDFTDLLPLERAIGGSTVVMLGEQTHADGTTFKAKVRLVKFLHERMGFDLLVFEAGLYDCREAWKKLLAGEPPVATARASIFEIWSYSTEVQPLFEYIGAHARGPRPLELAGLDPQFTGPIGGGTGARFVADLEAYLVSRGSSLTSAPEWPAFRAVADRIARQYYRDTESAPAERDAFAAGSALLQAETARLRGAASAANSFESSYWAQLASALDAQGRAWWASPPGGTFNDAVRYTFIRDSSMARNFLWTAREGYPGRKIVVWAASQHIAQRLDAVARQNGAAAFAAGYVPMGQLVKSELGTGVYTIAFIAGSGTAGPAAVHSGPTPAPAPIPQPPFGGWEWLFGSAGLSDSFLDLRKSIGEGDWMITRRTAGPLNYGAFVASWPQVFDAFFYTPVMAPATRAP